MFSINKLNSSYKLLLSFFSHVDILKLPRSITKNIIFYFLTIGIIIYDDFIDKLIFINKLLLLKSFIIYFLIILFKKNFSI